MAHNAGGSIMSKAMTCLLLRDGDDEGIRPRELRRHRQTEEGLRQCSSRVNSSFFIRRYTCWTSHHRDCSSGNGRCLEADRSLRFLREAVVLCYSVLMAALQPVAASVES